MSPGFAIGTIAPRRREFRSASLLAGGRKLKRQDQWRSPPSCSPLAVKPLRFEGIAKRYFFKKVVAVHLNESNELVEALIYVATNNSPGIPRPGYLEKIIHAARECGFPPEYVAELESWMATRRVQS
jgi:hypothetical protein